MQGLCGPGHVPLPSWDTAASIFLSPAFALSRGFPGIFNFMFICIDINLLSSSFKAEENGHAGRLACPRCHSQEVVAHLAAGADPPHAGSRGHQLGYDFSLRRSLLGVLVPLWLCRIWFKQVCSLLLAITKFKIL